MNSKHMCFLVDYQSDWQHDVGMSWNHVENYGD